MAVSIKAYNYKRLTTLDKRVVILLILLNSKGFLFSLAKVFHISEIVYLFPAPVTTLFKLGTYGQNLSVLYFVSCTLSLIALILILKKKVISFLLLQISAMGYLSVIFYKYFIEIDIEIIHALELLTTFIFLSSLFYFFLHLRKNGWFSLSRISPKTSVTFRIQKDWKNNQGVSLVSLASQGAPCETLKNVSYNATELASNGVKEIILTGNNVTEYGNDGFSHLDDKPTFFI